MNALLRSHTIQLFTVQLTFTTVHIQYFEGILPPKYSLGGTYSKQESHAEQNFAIISPLSCYLARDHTLKAGSH